jgi:hypothetical protein
MEVVEPAYQVTRSALLRARPQGKLTCQVGLLR